MRVSIVGLVGKKSTGLGLNSSNGSTWLDSKSLTELPSISPIDKVSLERAEAVAGNMH